MGYKKERFASIVAREDLSARYGDVHVFFGGTGAVGGTALLHMLGIYEEMMIARPPLPHEVPVLVATGRSKNEIRVFTSRLFRFIESRYGDAFKPTPIRFGYLTHSGVFVALEEFHVDALGAIDEIGSAPRETRGELVEEYLATLGTSTRADRGEIFAAVLGAVSKVRPFSAFLSRYREKHLGGRAAATFRSVIVGIPLPSLVAYHLDGLELARPHLGALTDEQMGAIKDGFITALRDDLSSIQAEAAENLIVAHTTAVGGMFDVVRTDGEPRTRIRLGFAHSAQDDLLVEKQKFADSFTHLYAAAGIKMLITAAAIGVDEVRIRSTIPLHKKISRALFEAASENVHLFGNAKPPQFVHVAAPVETALDSPADSPVSFGSMKSGTELRPSYVVRSGENGFFSVANADALYRVMRVASASELGLVLAMVGLFGDDPEAPWFNADSVCYYTETDNSRQVFDFLGQPLLQNVQFSGLEPMALQDLGSAKHQGELHTLGLLILLHRLRTLDIDAIPPYVDAARFDARAFFEAHSRPLTFEDVDTWELEPTARDLAVLVGATSPSDLEVLKPFRPRAHDAFFPEKQAARTKVLELVRHAVWTVTSLGSPILFERDATDWIRSGYFAAPLDLLVTNTAAFETEFRKRHAETGNPCSYADFRDYHITVGGFIDLRPRATLCSARSDAADLTGKIHVTRDEAAFRTVLAGLEPYSFFATSGLLAILVRLRSLYSLLKEAMLELGTLHDFRWQMPRDSGGHILVLPGAVEAMRMVSEGLEKTTGTERLDGLWGYERRRPRDRRAEILGEPEQAEEVRVGE